MLAIETREDDVIRIREKHLCSMDKMMSLAKKDEILMENIKTTYKTDDIIAWELNRLLHSPHPQFTKLRENAQYIEILDRWVR